VGVSCIDLVTLSDTKGTEQAGEETMIIRVWRGRTSAGDADGYERFLKEMAYPDYGGVPGNRG
jgi:hypothetical protein